MLRLIAVKRTLYNCQSFYQSPESRINTMKLQLGNTS